MRVSSEKKWAWTFLSPLTHNLHHITSLDLSSSLSSELSWVELSYSTPSNFACNFSLSLRYFALSLSLSRSGSLASSFILMCFVHLVHSVVPCSRTNSRFSLRWLSCAFAISFSKNPKSYKSFPSSFEYKRRIIPTFQSSTVPTFDWLTDCLSE